VSRQNPLTNPILRYAIGATGAIAVAAIASLLLDGTVQLVAYAVAALDLVVTPQVLKRAATG
jgi:hypothetical protein